MTEIKDLYVIEWMGPYDTLDELYEREGSEECFVYMITGRAIYERKLGIMYIGLTDRYVGYRLNDKDHQLKQQKIFSKQYWAGRYSRKSNVYNRQAHAELVEWGLIRYLIVSGVTLVNTKKTRTDPKKPMVIINKWQKKNSDENRYNKPTIMSALSDTILYQDGEYWGGDKLRCKNI